MAKGVTVIDGFTQYFGEDGFQAKDKLVTLKVKLITLTHTLVMLSRILGEISMVSGTTLMQTVLLLQVHKSSMVKKLYFNEDGSQVKRWRC